MAEDNTTPQKKPQLNDEERSVIQPIRTYERDVAESLRNSGASVVSINLEAHRVKDNKPKKEPEAKVLFERSSKPEAQVDRMTVMPQSPIKARPKIPPVPTPSPITPVPPPQPKPVSPPTPPIVKKVEPVKQPEPIVRPSPSQLEVPPPELNALRKPTDGKRYMYVEKEEAAKKSVFFLVSVVLVIAGLVAVGTIYILKVNQDPVDTIVTRPSTINTEFKEEKFVNTLSKNNLVALINEVKNGNRAPSTITEIILIDQNKVDEEISVQDFLQTMAPSAPGNLVRALNDEWLVGIYNKERSEPVIIMKLNSFENAFDGMLEWEKTMAGDLSGIFPTRDTGTTTAPVPTFRNNFEDLVIRNKDVRILKNSFGEIVLLYSFIDEQTLTITWSREGLEEVITRYLVSRGAR